MQSSESTYSRFWNKDRKDDGDSEHSSPVYYPDSDAEASALKKRVGTWDRNTMRKTNDDCTIDDATKKLLDGPETDLIRFLEKIPPKTRFQSLERIALPGLIGSLNTRTQKSILKEISDDYLFESLVERQRENSDGEMEEENGDALGELIGDADVEIQEGILKHVHGRVILGALLKKEPGTLKRQMGAVEEKELATVFSEFSLDCLLNAIKIKDNVGKESGEEHLATVFSKFPLGCLLMAIKIKGNVGGLS